MDMQVSTVRNKLRATKEDHCFKVSGQHNTLLLIKMVYLQGYPGLVFSLTQVMTVFSPHWLVSDHAVLIDWHTVFKNWHTGS